jgi:hypothetical protein
VPTLGYQVFKIGEFASPRLNLFVQSRRRMVVRSL